MIVSGSHAHHAQGFGFHVDGFIHYGVGNLFFDQMDYIETRQMFADKHVLYEGRHISTVLFTGGCNFRCPFCYNTDLVERPQQLADLSAETVLRFLKENAGLYHAAVITGGELTLDMLDLVYNPTARTYQAPLQLKSTGGIFIVDDLGRQAEPPQKLVNRWIVPLEESKDILALQSGEKFPLIMKSYIHLIGSGTQTILTESNVDGFIFNEKKCSTSSRMNRRNTNRTVSRKICEC